MDKCKICGKDIKSYIYIDEVSKAMDKHQMCFNCNFWRRMLEEDSKRDPHTWCVIDGTHYIIEPDVPNSAFQGFGGDEFQIEFNDGHKVVTHNLWCQGKPEEKYWQEKFPDNARFERNWKWVQIGDGQYLVEKKE